MAEDNRRSSLGYLGIDFQYRLISSFFLEEGFFSDLNSIIDQNMFTDAHLKHIVAIIKEYYNKYNSMISYDMLTIKLNEKVTNDDEKKYYTEIIDKLKHTSTDGHEEIELMAEKFFKQQNLIKVANKIKEVAGSGDIERYDECQRMLEEAASIGRKDRTVTRPLENIEALIQKEDVVTIPTGIKRLDELLEGGLDKGQVGLIICGSGLGKTSLTTCFGFNAAIHKCKENNNEGYKVLQIVFEDKNNDVGRKYLAKLTQIEAKQIGKDEETNNLVRRISSESPYTQMLNDNVKVMRLKSGEKTASDIKEEILKERNRGFWADVVIVDYFGCVKPERGFNSNSDITDRESVTMRKFETMASELDVALWIPTQGNRGSMSAETVTGNEIGGSFAKYQIAQVVLSISRTLDDVNSKRALFTILKQRNGGAGIKLPAMFDNGTCTVTIDNTISFDETLGFDEYSSQNKPSQGVPTKNDFRR